MRFVTLGASDSIGASCHLLQVAGVGVMLDAGTDPDEDGPDGLPMFDWVRKRSDVFIDHVLVSHAHHDHVGALPVLVREFPHVQVHMTRPTRELAEFVLPASARLQKRRVREGTATSEPLFDEEELDLQSFLYRSHDLERRFRLNGVAGAGAVDAAFYHSGHILGAAGIELSFEEGDRLRRVFYSGDTNIRSQSIIPGGSYPDQPIDVLILESTLGADPEAELTTRRTEELRFAEGLRRVWERGGTAVVPVFAVGRAQEVLALIDRYKRHGRLPAEVPVYTAGAMRAVAELYDRTRYSSPRLNQEFVVENVDQVRLPRSSAARRRALQEPGIHVISSGMMFERTLSNRIAQELVADEKNAVFLVGFAQEGTPADRLLAADARREESGEAEVVLDPIRGSQPLCCQVERFRLSGHSHRRDLLRLVERLSPTTVVLVHGETEARQWMADNINFFYPDIDIILPETGVPYEL
ncbi:MAG: MBL fold metallo-hydrolase [Rhodothermia bacterium]|nr:MBL fold metallo-hydrolase [Rhodothermia bacterium]